MQQQINFLDSLCGKMLAVQGQATAEKTSTQSSKRSAPSVTNTLMFLDLRGGGGNLLGAYWESNTVLPGEPTTHNTGECPRDERESTLSQILQENVPEKYFLSQKAALGILRRTKKRGKELPDMLKDALMELAGLDGDLNDIDFSECDDAEGEEEEYDGEEDPSDT